MPASIRRGRPDRDRWADYLFGPFKGIVLATAMASLMGIDDLYDVRIVDWFAA